jgi:alpha-glucosidase
LPFNFQLLASAWKAEEIARIVTEYEGLLPIDAWPNWVLGNHDNPRVASRIGREQVRVAATLLLTLRGTPTIYYGEEIGMENVLLPVNQSRDPYGQMQPGIGVGRDPERSPMQWNSTASAGFTSGKPWLPVAQDFTSCNVEILSKNPHSILSMYRQLIALRRHYPALNRGSLQDVQVHQDVLTYRRKLDLEEILVVLNFSSAERSVRLPNSSKLLFTTAFPRQTKVEARDLSLGPDEGAIFSVGVAPWDAPA